MTITRSSKFLVRPVAVCFSLLCVGHVVIGRAFAAQSSPAKQGADQSGAADDPFKKPLTLESYKSFFVGGERVKRPDGTLGMTGHLYVEAFIPVNAKPTPIVMLHTTTSGTNFLGRANGEEGWATMFARAGYPVYVVDPPGTGRAGVDLTVNDKSKIKQGGQRRVGFEEARTGVRQGWVQPGSQGGLHAALRSHEPDANRHGWREQLAGDANDLFLRFRSPRQKCRPHCAS